MQFDVTINGRPLSEFCAKMQSYPVVSACEIDTEVFQGADRSSIQLLQNRRGGRTLTCRVDFIETNNAKRTACQSALEALFLGRVPAEIDFGDGYQYTAVLTGIKNGGTVSEIISTVEYTFRVVRHQAPVVVDLVPRNANILCRSNVPKTDCIVCLPFVELGKAKNTVVSLNGLQWGFAPELTDDLVLDGVNKIFTMGGVNVTNQIVWSDFPFLVPGVNSILVAIQGIVTSKNITISYTPTFL